MPKTTPTTGRKTGRAATGKAPSEKRNLNRTASLRTSDDLHVQAVARAKGLRLSFSAYVVELIRHDLAQASRGEGRFEACGAALLDPATAEAEPAKGQD